MQSVDQLEVRKKRQKKTKKEKEMKRKEKKKKGSNCFTLQQQHYI